MPKIVYLLEFVWIGLGACSGSAVKDGGHPFDHQGEEIGDGGVDGPDARGEDIGLWGGWDASDDVRGVDGGLDETDEIWRDIQSCDPSRFDRALWRGGWGQGWPMERRGMWLFATKFDDAPPMITLVGDMNGWNQNEWPTVRCPDGRRFFVEVPESAFRRPAIASKYKWFASHDGSYRPPMEATQYGYDHFGRFGWVRAPLEHGRLEQYPAFRSRFLEEPRSLRAYLPPGFIPHSPLASRMRTLLLHDGQNVFHPDAWFGGWRVNERLERLGAQVVAIAVDNASDRMDAYTHVQDDVGMGRVGGRAEAYLAMLKEEVLPFFRARYGIVAEGASLAIAGSSLGGLVTLFAAQRWVPRFGCAIAMSSTLRWGSFSPSAPRGNTLIELWRGRPLPIYLDHGGDVDGGCIDGDGDGIEDDARDTDNFCT
ncbi:MAG: alpha/beta hydrolase-fold protein, partial [Deltaproteobacteria bacterium]|nr:alpha/beta hydrolase-fold protein [Deltaproteobacteria bacterium]